MVLHHWYSRFSAPEAGQAAESFLCSECLCVCVCVCLTFTLCSGDDIAEQPFEPGFLRPQPPLYHSEEEAMWLNPTQGQCPIQWDTLMCSHSAAGVLFQPIVGVAHYHDVIL